MVKTMNKLYRCNLAGISFAMEDNPELKDLDIIGCTLSLVKRPNEYDANAIAVEDVEGNHFGYMGRGKNQDMAALAIKFYAEKNEDNRIWCPCDVVDQAYASYDKQGKKHFHKERFDGELGSLTVQFEIPDEVRDYIRVSSFVKALDDSFGADHLIRWAFNQGTTYDNYKDKLDELSVAGTDLHDSIEEYFRKEENFQPKKEIGQDCLPKGFDHFVKRFKPKAVLDKYHKLCFERRFYDSKLGVTGKYDALLYMNDKLTVCDYKSASACRLSMKLQVSIYAYNLMKEFPGIEQAMVICWGNKKNKCGYSVTKLDKATIIKYYNMMIKLSEIINELGIKARGNKCIRA